MSMNPHPENPETPDHSAGKFSQNITPKAPQHPLKSKFAPDIDLDTHPQAPSETIIEDQLYDSILQDAPEPYPHTPEHTKYKPILSELDNQPQFETHTHHGAQPSALEYPAPLHPVQVDHTTTPIIPETIIAASLPIAADTPPTTKKSPASSITCERIHSVDALRGFDMFWIVGGNILLLQLAKLYDWTWLKWATTQLHHPVWEGFTFFDLIFPLFLFLAGVSMPISLGKKIDQGASKTSLLRKVTFRSIILILLGIIYNGGLELKPIADTRLCSVLGFIGISYFIAALIFILSDVKHRIIWALGLLLGYYAALIFINVPDHGTASLTPEGIFTGYIDRNWAAWKLYTPNFDPEGLFLPVAGAVVAIAGSLTGSFLVRCTWNKFIKVILLGAAGVSFYYASIFLEPHMIISKSFWSPTFILHCLGWSLMLLAVFYLIMDAIGFWHWAFFFIVIGMNSITIYMGLKLFNIQQTSNKLFAGTIDHFFKIEYQPLLTTITFILTWWTILFFMYRKKIFLRI